jgi:C1A family cysteine protease
MKLLELIALISIICVVACSGNVKLEIMDAFMDKPAKEAFKVYHLVFKKEYSLDSEEGVRRYEAFKSNLKTIKETNAQNLPYKLGINKFADLTSQEFTDKYLMKNQPKLDCKKGEEEGKEGYFDKYADEDEIQFLSGVNAFEKPVSWRHLFRPARDQGQCGSCYSFAASALVEAYINQKNGDPSNLAPYISTQQCMDCGKYNKGCDGGSPFYCLAQGWQISKKGFFYDQDYPYKMTKETCKFNNISVPYKKPMIPQSAYCLKYCPHPSTRCREDKQYELLLQHPLIAGVDGMVLQLYKSGIFTATCKESNHAVVIVGADKDPTSNLEFFDVRNSWGEDWGEKGYFRVARNRRNKDSCFLNEHVQWVGPFLS